MVGEGGGVWLSVLPPDRTANVCNNMRTETGCLVKSSITVHWDKPGLAVLVRLVLLILDQYGGAHERSGLWLSSMVLSSMEFFLNLKGMCWCKVRQTMSTVVKNSQTMDYSSMEVLLHQGNNIPTVLPLPCQY